MGIGELSWSDWVLVGATLIAAVFVATATWLSAVPTGRADSLAIDRAASRPHRSVRDNLAPRISVYKPPVVSETP